MQSRMLIHCCLIKLIPKKLKAITGMKMKVLSLLHGNREKELFI